MITTSPIKPTIGRIVYVFTSGLLANGATTPVPAIVNAVHGDNCVSVTAFPFAAAPVCVTSLPYAEPEGDEALPNTFGWWWMPYQKTVAAERDPVTGAPRVPLSEMRFGGGDVDKAPEPA